MCHNFNQPSVEPSLTRSKPRRAGSRYRSTKNLFPVVCMLVATKYLSCVESYMLNIEAGADNECFHEKVPAGIKLGFSFEVIEGGLYDIDYFITDPNNVIVRREDEASSGNITIEATYDGSYTLCFDNSRVTQKPKLIIFDIERSDIVKTGIKTNAAADGTSKPDDETEKLMRMVDDLLMSTTTARHRVRFLTARDRIHRKINDATNSRIVWWCGVEFILLLVVTLGQVWYLRRFFEIRRKT